MPRVYLSFKLVFRATFVSSISLERPEVHPTAQVSWLRNNSTNPRVIDLVPRWNMYPSTHIPQFRSFFFFFFPWKIFSPSWPCVSSILGSFSPDFVLCTYDAYVCTYRLNQRLDVKIRSHKSASSIQGSRFYRRDRGSNFVRVILSTHGEHSFIVSRWLPDPEIHLVKIVLFYTDRFEGGVRVCVEPENRFNAVSSTY